MNRLKENRNKFSILHSAFSFFQARNKLKRGLSSMVSTVSDVSDFWPGHISVNRINCVASRRSTDACAVSPNESDSRMPGWSGIRHVTSCGVFSCYLTSETYNNKIFHQLNLINCELLQFKVWALELNFRLWTVKAHRGQPWQWKFHCSGNIRRLIAKVNVIRAVSYVVPSENSFRRLTLNPWCCRRWILLETRKCITIWPHFF